MKDSMSADINTEPFHESDVNTEKIDNGNDNSSTIKNSTTVNVNNDDKLDLDTTLMLKEDAVTENIKTNEKTNNQSNCNQHVTVENNVDNMEISTDKANSKPDGINKSIETENSQNVNEGGKKKRKRKRPPIRPRVRKRLLMMALQLESGNANTENSTMPEDVEYCLTVTNLPNNWSFMDIKNYIDTECGPVDEVEFLKDDKTDKGAIRLSYPTEQECKHAMSKLVNKEIEGSKLVLEMSVVSLEEDSPESPLSTTPAEEPKPVKLWRPDLDVWEIDPEGLYGLKREFLESLNIVPPLDKWVYVSNFRCDKSELKEVLELAGTVIMCTVFNVSPKYANVMYSHPLEAVQAVSMLNDQKFYGLKLKVHMDRSPGNTVILPKGLESIGPGLGAHGKPLLNITKHYKRFVTNRSSSINLKAFEVPDSVMSIDEVEPMPFAVKNVTELESLSTSTSSSTTVTVTTTDKTKVTPTVTDSKTTPAKQSPQPNYSRNNQNKFEKRSFGPNQGWNGPRMPGPMGAVSPMHRPMGPMQGPRQGPMQGPMQNQMSGPMWPMNTPMRGPMQGASFGPRQQSMAGPMQRPMQPMQGPMRGPIPPNQGQMPTMVPGQVESWSGIEPVKLHLSNLPPSATFHVLCGKMAECGQVVSIQLTTPGCAVVTYANRMQADLCYQTYHGKIVDGHKLQIKYSTML